MATNVDALIDEVIQREGGYVDHPNDRGGPTRYGITQATARANGYQGAMRDLPRELAVTIYRQQYWLKPRLDQIDARAPTIAERLFDIGVNSGPATGVRFLQRSLNVLNHEGQPYRDIAADGLVGPGTIGALEAFLKQRGHTGGEAVLLAMVVGLQSVNYIEIAERTASQEAFMFGWQRNRVLRG
jgi:lysozyme family protein